LKRFVDPAVSTTSAEIEAHYMGAGTVFIEYLSAAPAAAKPPRSVAA
jgi:hypothetical protein